MIDLSLAVVFFFFGPNIYNLYHITNAAHAITQVPNEIRMRHEALDGGELLRYVCKKRQRAVYRAAAKLWARGVSWANALSIMTEAFDSSFKI